MPWRRTRRHHKSESPLPPQTHGSCVQAAAAFGFDGIKVDACGNEPNITAWAVAANATGRPLMLGAPLSRLLLLMLLLLLCCCLCLLAAWASITYDPPLARRELQRQLPLPPPVLRRVPLHLLPHEHRQRAAFPLGRLEPAGHGAVPGHAGASHTAAPLAAAAPNPAASSCQSGPGCFAYADMLEIGAPALGDPSIPNDCPGKARLTVEEARGSFGAWCAISSLL